MLRWKRPIMKLVVPLILAYAIIALEGPIAAFAVDHPGLLPVAMVSLVACLLMPAARRWVVVTLCFGIGLLALRDTFRPVWIPSAIDFVVVERVYPFGWALLAILALVAGVAEALRPGSVWSRRCYFAAATVYFGGHGLFSFIKFPNWQSAVLMATGVVAIFGIFNAHRIVAAENAEAEDDEDIRALAAETQRRSARLADREWREAAEQPSVTAASVARDS
jgi:hypothetical protein